MDICVYIETTRIARNLLFVGGSVLQYKPDDCTEFADIGDLVEVHYTVSKASSS